MRIGILTLPLHVNYGGILQAYALQTVLERMGHEVEVIATPLVKLKISWKRKILAYPKRILLKYLFQRKEVSVFYEKHINESNMLVQQNTQKFIQRYIHRHQVSSLLALKEQDFDAIVVGSDQVWRKVYFTNSNEPLKNAFLQFAQRWKIRRVAYAPSFGTDDWEYSLQDTNVCAALIKYFDALSVREKSAVKLCSQYLGVDACHVLDPTMLLDARDYTELVESNHTPHSKGNMHCYILDRTPETNKLIDYIASEHHLIPFFVGADTYNLEVSELERIQPPVERWLQAFREAEYIVTDSFHACVFSILYRKPFVVYGNKERGMARFHSLLSLFGLEDRLVTNIDDYKSLCDIDYDVVYEKLNNMRKISFDFLAKALGYE